MCPSSREPDRWNEHGQDSWPESVDERLWGWDMTPGADDAPPLNLLAPDDEFRKQQDARRRWFHSRCNGDDITCPWCDEFNAA